MAKDKNVTVHGNDLYNMVRAGTVENRAADKTLAAGIAALRFNIDGPDEQYLVKIDEARLILKNLMSVKAGDPEVTEINAELDKSRTHLAALNADLNKELGNALALLPEKDRDAYRKGFLHHYDLLEVKAADGSITYAPNPNKEKAQDGNYIPAAFIKSGKMER